MLENKFKIPDNFIGKFAIVKLWPQLKTAEDECIARLKIAATQLGIECVEINANGSFLEDPNLRVTKQNIDFVIHLHYDTPKQYDAFSFIALWNPLKFYHEWGYARTSRNLTTHDDFLSCSSIVADAHVARLIRNTSTHLPAKFNLYHTTAHTVHPPSIGAGKLFYAGINWETINGGKSRHQEVLRKLDGSGLLRIFGPTLFQGVKVWDGYKSYVKEIPFDGKSMIDEISITGIALVFSSNAHKDSELMSNRLFESVAAGSLVICDENPFAKKFFGDSLLYIDSRSPVDQVVSDILGHVAWARAKPQDALKMITKAQSLFRDRFTLVRNLCDLYNGLEQRKQELLNRQNPQSDKRIDVRLYFLMPIYSSEVLKSHIESINRQEYLNFAAAILVDTRDGIEFRSTIISALALSPIKIEIIMVDFYTYGIPHQIKTRARLGGIIQQLVESTKGYAAFIVIAPNESLFSNHVSVLCGALERNELINCAATAALILDGDVPIHSVSDLLDFGHFDRKNPTGYGRFIFRTAGIPHDTNIALPYLDGRPLAILIANSPIDQQLPASIKINIKHEFVEQNFDDANENEIIKNYNKSNLRIFTGHGPLLQNYAPSALPHTQPKKKRLIEKLLKKRWRRAIRRIAEKTIGRIFGK